MAEDACRMRVVKVVFIIFMFSAPVCSTIIIRNNGNTSVHTSTSSNQTVRSAKPCKVSGKTFEDTAANFVMKLITQVKCNMEKGVPDLKIPPLDPLTIPDQNLSLNKSRLKVSGKVNNITIRNLSSFAVTDITTDVIEMAVNISVFIPFFILQGHYDINGKAVSIIPVYGKGPFTIKPINVTCAVFATAGINDESEIALRSLQFKVDVKQLHSKFEGAYGGGSMSRLFNSIVDRLGSYIFHKVEPKVHKRIRSILFDEINKLLKGTKLTDVIDKAF